MEKNSDSSAPDESYVAHEPEVRDGQLTAELNNQQQQHVEDTAAAAESNPDAATTEAEKNGGRESSDTEDEAEEEPPGPHEWDGMDAAERLQRAKELKLQGNDEFSEGNYEESIKTYTKGLGFCPDTEPVFRSILFANRSAAKMKLGMKKNAVKDCTQAIEHNPNYVRALLRRAKLHEELEKLEESLADYHKVLELDPTNREASLAAHRLPGEINEKNEKLKTEMLGKLKELGNMVLRPFGLSTDNFQLQQDPNTGSYSVNFNKT